MFGTNASKAPLNDLFDLAANLAVIRTTLRDAVEGDCSFVLGVLTSP